MYDIYADIITIIKEEIKLEALSKIARRQERNADIGRAKQEIARAQLLAARNKHQTQQLQIKNKQLKLWEHRHRTTR